MPFLALDLPAPHRSLRIDAGPAFSALLMLWLSGGGRTSSTLRCSHYPGNAHDGCEPSAIIGPQMAIVVDRPFRRRSFANLTHWEPVESAYADRSRPRAYCPSAFHRRAFRGGIRGSTRRHSRQVTQTT
jgi:hypothetical protein